MYGAKPPSSMLTQVPAWNAAPNASATMRAGRHSTSSGKLSSQPSTSQVSAQVTLNGTGTCA